MSKVLIIQHIECEDPGIISTLLKEMDIVSEYFDDSISSLKDHRGLIILGGPMGVYETDKYPLLKKEIDLIREALNYSLPIMGICLGAQLLIKAVQGDVYKGNKKEIGWYNIRLTEEGMTDPLFRGIPEEIMVFQWHGDTFNLPDNCVRLASSDIYPNQAFRFRDNAYGLQFHLEVTYEMILSWLDEYDEEVDREDVDVERIIKDSKIYINPLMETGKIIFKRFLSLVH
jgi:GMP synthase (glutamine-hydrolysing)